jgi:hypothetical protein
VAVAEEKETVEEEDPVVEGVADARVKRLMMLSSWKEETMAKEEGKMEEVKEEEEVEEVESCRTIWLSLQLWELREEIKTSSPHLRTRIRPHIRTHIIEAMKTKGLRSFCPLRNKSLATSVPRERETGEGREEDREAGAGRLHCPCPRVVLSRVGACREAVRRAGLQWLQGKLREGQSGGLEHGLEGHPEAGWVAGLKGEMEAGGGADGLTVHPLGGVYPHIWWMVPREGDGGVMGGAGGDGWERLNWWCMLLLIVRVRRGRKMMVVVEEGVVVEVLAEAWESGWERGLGRLIYRGRGIWKVSKVSKVSTQCLYIVDILWRWLLRFFPRKGHFVIGRDPKHCDVVIRHPSISRV